jgi:hypothetical protein
LSTGASEGAYFEHEQTIRNPYNNALELMAENGTPVAVFAAGPLLPSHAYNKKLATSINNAEQAFYYGCYRIVAQGEQEAQSEDEMLQLVQEMKSIYPKIDSSNCRFLLKRHRQYWLEPIDYPCHPGGYSYVQVHVKDQRCPLFPIPGNMSINKAFGARGPKDFTEDSMITQWYKNGGLNEFVTSPFEPRGVKSSNRNSARNQPIDCLPSGERISLEATESSYIILAPSESIGPSTLAAFVVTSCSQLEHWFTVMSSSIASFLRAGQVNVDSGGNIGPLLDYDRSVHKTGTSTDLGHYKRVFGDIPLLPYTGYLGLELQRSPLTHPIQSYDPSRMAGLSGYQRSPSSILAVDLALPCCKWVQVKRSVHYWL